MAWKKLESNKLLLLYAGPSVPTAPYKYTRKGSGVEQTASVRGVLPWATNDFAEQKHVEFMRAVTKTHAHTNDQHVTDPELSACVVMSLAFICRSSLTLPPLQLSRIPLKGTGTINMLSQIPHGSQSEADVIFKIGCLRLISP